MTEADVQWEKLLSLKRILHRVLQELDDELDELEEKLLKLLSDTKYINASAPLVRVLLEVSAVGLLLFFANPSCCRCFCFSCIGISSLTD
jgi:hypothetical protein